MARRIRSPERIIRPAGSRNDPGSSFTRLPLSVVVGAGIRRAPEETRQRGEIGTAEQQAGSDRAGQALQEQADRTAVEISMRRSVDEDSRRSGDKQELIESFHGNAPVNCRTPYREASFKFG